MVFTALLVVSLGKALSRMPLFCCNGEVAHPAYRKRRLLGTQQWQSALLVTGLPVIQDWFEMRSHLSPSLIQLG